MKRIIEKACSITGYGYNEIAAYIFPDLTGYTGKRHAMHGVLNHKRRLTLDELKRLSDLCGVSLDELIQESDWTARAEKGLYRFTTVGYEAVLDISGEYFRTLIYSKAQDGKKDFKSQVIHSSNNIKLSEYLTYLNSITYELDS